MTLVEGRWYRWPGGVCLIEKVGPSQATAKIMTSEVVQKDFQTADGDSVSFSTKKGGRLGISPNSVLEPATDEEIALFTARKRQPGKPKAEPKSRPAPAARPAPATKPATEPAKMAGPRGTQATKSVEARATPGKSCSFSDDDPASHRIVWTYLNGKRTFRLACTNHAERFAAKHGLTIGGSA